MDEVNRGLKKKGGDLVNDAQLKKMEQTPMFKLVVTMSIPAVLSMLVQSLYNIVDSIFVAQIGEKALTAVSLAFPIQTLIVGVAVGTGIGLNSLIARSLGEKNIEKANEVAGQGIWLAILSWIVFLAFGLFGTKAFFDFFTTDQAVVAVGTQYLGLVTTFSIGVFIQITIEKIFQGSGNMVYPMMMQLVGAIINIILDPIFIFGWFGVPAMGVAGAAIATVTGQFVAAGISLYLILKRSKGIKIKLGRFNLDKTLVKEIYRVGFPSILMQSIMSFLVIILNNLLIQFSQTSVSVLGIYFKLQSFVFMPVFGLTQGVMPIMGYSYGAKNKKRLIECLKWSTLLVLVIMSAGTILFMGYPKQLIQMFNGTEEMIVMGSLALRIISSTFVCAGISIVMSTLFQAMGDGTKSLVISVIRQILILLPVAVVLSYRYQETGVWIAFSVAEVCALILSLLFFRVKYEKEISKM